MYKAAFSRNKHLELIFAQKPPNIKVVACLLAAAVADPLGAGAVGDGCELQKVLRKKKIKFLHIIPVCYFHLRCFEITVGWCVRLCVPCRDDN